MRKLFVLVALAAMVIAVFGSSVAFADVATPTGHATTVTSNTSTMQVRIETRVIPGPAKLCKALIEKYPSLAANAQGCNFVIVMKSSTNVALVPNSCAGGTTTNEYTNSGLLRAFGGTLKTTFVYHGNCTRPGISYQHCSDWAVWPNSISNNDCYTFPNGSNLVSEGDWHITQWPASYDFGIQEVANPYNNSVTDIGYGL